MRKTVDPVVQAPPLEHVIITEVEATTPAQLTDGQLLAKLRDAEREHLAFGEDGTHESHNRYAALLEEARRRCLLAAL